MTKAQISNDYPSHMFRGKESSKSASNLFLLDVTELSFTSICDFAHFLPLIKIQLLKKSLESQPHPKLPREEKRACGRSTQMGAFQKHSHIKSTAFEWKKSCEGASLIQSVAFQAPSKRLSQRSVSARRQEETIRNVPSFPAPFHSVFSRRCSPKYRR